MLLNLPSLQIAYRSTGWDICNPSRTRKMTVHYCIIICEYMNTFLINWFCLSLCGWESIIQCCNQYVVLLLKDMYLKLNICHTLLFCASLTGISNHWGKYLKTVCSTWICRELILLRWVNNYRQCMFKIFYSSCRDLTSTAFFKIILLLFDAWGPLLYSLLYALRIKSFGLRDKLCMHHFLAGLALSSCLILVRLSLDFSIHS